MSLGGKPRTEFQHHVQGTWGSFGTPAGRVDYILTKARLGKEGTDPERRLTGHLAPVREVLQSDDLDFNQLLQRDLDDHRVSVNLIPYLLTTNPTGPAFFPPVVAVLLPFETMRPSEFEPLEPAPGIVKADGLDWRQHDAGSQARVRRLVYDDGSTHAVKLAQLWWNEEHARLVVLDGQHRAMALLAIDRTIRRTWQGSGGERYRFFYENRVKELLSDASIDLDGIEVPVAVTWLPELFGPGKRPHMAARKLFVDVNKEARRPSESRLILLSDSELRNIFTRRLLSELRNDKEGELLPLYAVEYDNPDVKPTQSARWSAMTNIHILQQMTKRLIFGPPKYLLDVTQKIGRRESPSEMDMFMRQQLAVTDEVAGQLVPPEIVDDGITYRRDQLGDEEFPLGRKDLLESRFAVSWGSAILDILTRMKPYSAHSSALSRLKEEWVSANAVDGLAYEALFGGVGMYWTLRDSALHHQQQAADAGAPMPKPDTVKAWELVVSKQRDFEVYRATEYLKTSNGEKVKACSQAFQMFNTHACQVGLALTLGTLWTSGIARTEDLNELPAFAAKTVDAINTWMDSSSGSAYDRRLFLNRSGTKAPFNAISALDAPRAVEFRYFWLEVLASDESLEVLGQSVDSTALKHHRDLARQHYLNYWRDQTITSLKGAKPGQSDQERRQEATDMSQKGLRTALKKWFNITGDEFSTWHEDLANPNGQHALAPEVATETEAPADAEDVDDDPESDDENVSIDDLIDRE